VRLFRRGEGGTSVDLLVAGLGNPGPEHARDRHNVGWMVVDELARRHGGSFKGKFRGRVGDVRIGDAKLVLLKPETYMNESGSSIQAAASFYKTPIERVLVVHDEVDLEGQVAATRGPWRTTCSRRSCRRTTSRPSSRVRATRSRRSPRRASRRRSGASTEPLTRRP
jgi:hypothetical protein